MDTRSSGYLTQINKFEKTLRAVRRGEAVRVPPTERDAVMHLHEAMSTSLVAHHKGSAYARALDDALRHAAGSAPGAADGAADGAATPRGRVAVGQLCAISGLTQRPDLNGRLGKYVRTDPATGRMTLDVEDGIGPVALKPANVHPLDL